MPATTTTKGLIVQQLKDMHGIDVRNDDFHALRSSQVDGILHWADAYGYRKPESANGSRARSFFEMLQKYARKNPNK